MTQQKTYRAFLSSTYEDLKDHRMFVIEELRKSGIDVDPMEDWTAAPQEPKEFSKERVKGCDLLVLLVALRRGHVPKGEKRSITQLEHQTAIDEGIEVLVFMLKEEAAWSRKFDELDKDPELHNWRNELKEHKGVGFFDYDPRTIEIAPALTRWVNERRLRELNETERVTDHKTDFLRTPWLGIEVWQNNQRRPIFKIDKDYWASREAVRIPLLPAPFELRFANIDQSDSVMVTAWIDSSIFDQISGEMERESVPYFRMGTGMADTTFGSGTLWLDNRGHNHFDRDHRLIVEPNGNAKVMFNTIHIPDGSIDFPQNTDIFAVIYQCEYNIHRIRSYERIILSFR